MKSTFSRFTFLIFVLFFLIPNSILAKTIDQVSLNQEERRAGILNDTTKKESQSTFSLTNNAIRYSATDIKNNSHTKGKFELGLEFGIFSTNIEYSLSYKTLPKGGQQSEANIHHSIMSGLNVASQLTEKWWLQTGIRYGCSTWSNNISFPSSYNKSGERILPTGEVHYDLTLINYGQLSESETQINVSITNASSLDNDDWIISLFSVEKQLDWVQIPIGVVYHLGKKQLNYEIKGGLSLNQITISNYNIEGLIEGAVSIFNITEIVYPPSDNKRFIEAYLGAGIRYNLKENIILSTNLNLRYSHNTKVVVTDIYTGFHCGASCLF